MNMLGLRLLPAALLVGASLSGCSLIPPFATCEGTDAALAGLDQLPALTLRPAPATPVGGEAGATAYCTDDTGDAWLTARRTYAYDGSRAEVLEYYAREAPAAGWRPVHDLDSGAARGFTVFCFESRERPSLTLAFDSPEGLRTFYGIDPGPAPAGPGSRIWFSLSTEAATDGSRMDC
ncbi:hypothetical protein ACFY04_15705 [Streptomyces sp. NPDC001549]|uniref:hypothetical protein n=1 Tax=Streptomyces sp. NPDC001549 TaxID=3364586 RepID=UPI0036D126B7